MATGIIGPSLTIAQLAVTLAGVPFASGGVMALQMINTTCAQVSYHKHKSEQLIKRCVSLLNFVNEQSSLLVGTDAHHAFDEAENVLYSIHERLQKWEDCGRLKSFFKSAEIAKDLDKCRADVDHVMERLHVANPVTLIRMQKQSMDLMNHNHATLAELQQLLISSREVEEAAQRHGAGGNEARELMRLGQERLINFPQGAHPSSTMLSDGRQIDQSPPSSRPPSPVITVQNQIEQALLDLHRLTHIPPTIHILNNQVKMLDTKPTRGGPYSAICEGRWLGEKKVALKTLRVLDENDPRSQRMQTRFENEIAVWSKLSHENILLMLGIVTNMGPIYIVSPWQSDNVRNYRYRNPDVNPLELLTQASKGLEYLHDQEIVHGNLKCNNVMVSEEGIVSLSDFGLTQVLNDIVGKSAMQGLSTMAAIRWQAPELNKEDIPPTMATDIFAFGMSILELLTMKHPYSHRRRDIGVLRDLMDGVLPPRPEEPEAAPWMSDGLWEALQRCWKWNAKERMQAREVVQCLERELKASTATTT